MQFQMELKNYYYLIYQANILESLLNLCQKFPENCFPMMGLHPCDVTKENFEEEIHHVENELNKNKYIAVGEIGIDLYWDKSTIEIQKKLLRTKLI